MWIEWDIIWGYIHDMGYNDNNDTYIYIYIPNILLNHQIWGFPGIYQQFIDDQKNSMG
jgi:hypothetical protein